MARERWIQGELPGFSDIQSTTERLREVLGTAQDARERIGELRERVPFAGPKILQIRLKGAA